MTWQGATGPCTGCRATRSCGCAQFEAAVRRISSDMSDWECKTCADDRCNDDDGGVLSGSCSAILSSGLALVPALLGLTLARGAF